jgi:hypothetical protein
VNDNEIARLEAQILALAAEVERLGAERDAWRLKAMVRKQVADSLVHALWSHTGLSPEILIEAPTPRRANAGTAAVRYPDDDSVGAPEDEP